jgi:hypothetical protein
VINRIAFMVGQIMFIAASLTFFFFMLALTCRFFNWVML